MSDFTADHLTAADHRETGGPELHKKAHPAGAIAFFAVLAAGLLFVAFSINRDIATVGETNIASAAFILLGLALLIALGFEFVNGFHVMRRAL